MTGYVVIGVLGILGCLSGVFMLVVAMKSLKKAEKILGEAERLYDDAGKIIEMAQGYSTELSKQEKRIQARIAEFTE